jgi:hypothetical protein
MRTAIIIPAWNEAAAIGRVLAEIPKGIADEVFVVDGGSTDGTRELARAAGATVLRQQGRGYGAACLTGARAASSDLLVFLDGDYSDPPGQIARLLTPLIEGRAGLVLGSRERGRMAPGALPLHARLGNAVAVRLLRLLYGLLLTDLPSFKAIRRNDLLALGIRDLHYGWTAEMIARATRRDLRVREVPIDYRVRIGESKVSGTLKGSVQAGYAILRAVIGVRLAPLPRRPLHRFAHRLGGDDVEPRVRLAPAQGGARDEGAAEAELFRFRQPLVEVADRAELTGEADLAEGDHIAGQRLVAVARRDRQRDAQVGGGFVHLQTTDDIDDQVLVAEADARPLGQHGGDQQQPGELDAARRPSWRGDRRR